MMELPSLIRILLKTQRRETFLRYKVEIHDAYEKRIERERNTREMKREGYGLKISIHEEVQQYQKLQY